MPARRVKSTIRQYLIRLDTRLQQELDAELDSCATDALANLRKYTADWKNKPAFSKRKTIRPDVIALAIFPRANQAGKIFKWVDRGTGKYRRGGQPYRISPKAPNTRLTFRTNYSPKTAAASSTQGFGAYGGLGRALGGFVSVRSVMHPGIKPRYMSEAAIKKLNPPYVDRIENAIRRAVRRAK